MLNKVSVVVISGDREQLQMAAMLASVAAVSGSEVTIFLSAKLDLLPIMKQRF